MKFKRLTALFLLIVICSLFFVSCNKGASGNTAGNKVGDICYTYTLEKIGGDGTDDIVVRKLSDKGLWVWENGDSSTAHWVGTPDEGFAVEAVGDYNGDGKDDLLLREHKTGWGGVGYWASADASKWSDLDARIETGFSSNFSIIA